MAHFRLHDRNTAAFDAGAWESVHSDDPRGQSPDDHDLGLLGQVGVALEREFGVVGERPAGLA